MGARHVSGFGPSSGADALALVLGSLPGVASLSAVQYYAHPRNGFWPIMGALVGADPALPYPERLQRLIDAKIALWDVFARAERPGSLDSAIVDATARVNDFAGFFARHRQVRTVLLNGGKAHAAFRRLVLPSLAVPPSIIALPSTSPANASHRLDMKTAAWRDALQAAGIEVLG